MGVTAEEPDYQKQFEAAVRVIQGLPRNGAYRPSYEEMLRFYGYYKQATVGQCQIPRPGFWDPIGRYKWDAWNRLGKMTKEEAMAAYIAEMKKAAQKVIDTVPMNKSSEDMFAYFEPLYETIHDMPRPPEYFFKKKSEPSHEDEVVKNKHTASDSESEVFCDSLEQMEPDQARRSSAKQNSSLTSPHSFETGEKDLQMAPSERGFSSSPEVIEESPAGALKWQKVDLQMANTIRALQEDMKKVMERLSYLESLAALQGDASISNPCRPTALHDGKALPGWPVQLSPRTFLFLMAWPFVVQWLLWRFQSRKR
ncbi:acyl-CoA-binding domain-containing protein 4 [Tiliqua scincoides]|uniref:acyl-CoA-binding domain-containing protein 4 n=1 Tax=Tiliqua scincoides TaxID=71010 RepID=UPI0034631807